MHACPLFSDSYMATPCHGWLTGSVTTLKPVHCHEIIPSGLHAYLVNALHVDKLNQHFTVLVINGQHWPSLRGFREQKL